MRITKSINLNNRAFQAISDNTTDALQSPQDTLFVRTFQNLKYLDSEILQNFQNLGVQILDAHDLGQVFALPAKIIGITGTNGKTTTATFIYECLLDFGKKAAMLGTRGLFINGVQVKPKGLTTPCVLELYENFELANNAGCEYFVMEVSSHAIAQERIAGVHFDCKILTNITQDHLDFHKSIEEYRAVKNSFFADVSLKIINADEPNARFNAQNALLYGVENADFQNLANFENLNFQNLKSVRAKNIKVSESGQEFELVFQNLDSENALNLPNTRIKTQLFGLHNIYNLLAGVGAMMSLNALDVAQMADFISRFDGVQGRAEVVSTQPLIIVDFAHTPDGMQQIFKSFADRKIFVVFGAGGDRDKSKRPLMGAMAQKFAHKIYVTSDNPRSENPSAIIEQILSGISQSCRAKCVVSVDRKQAIECAIVDILEHDKECAKICDMQAKLTTPKAPTTLEALAMQAMKEIPTQKTHTAPLTLKTPATQDTQSTPFAPTTQKPLDSENRCVLLILGKGDENFQIIGDQKIPFDDRKIAKDILKKYK